MMIESGYELVPVDWHVDEKMACGFVRVYDVYGGEVVCHEADKDTVLPAGCICLFPSAAPYSLEQNPKNPLWCAHLHLDIAPALLRSMRIVQAPAGSVPRAIFDAVRCSVMQQEERVTSRLAEAFEEYCRSRKMFSMPEGEIAQALAVMSAEFRKNWTVGELSAISGYSEPYFIRRFRAETGMSPHQYLISRRMKEALRLLWTDLPITQVAEQVGYPELKAFSRAFRQWYGISPTQCRENGRINP